MLISDSPGGILAKWTVVNALWIALLGACWHQGWLGYIFEKDITFISHAIAFVGILTIVVSYVKAIKISKLHKNVGHLIEAYREKVTDAIHKEDRREALSLELTSHASILNFIASTALAVGVLGTVVGLVMGFANLNPAAISDVTNVGPAVAQLLVGLSVAFHTTLVGGLVNLWLRTNHYLLMQDSAHLYRKVLGG